MPDTNDRFVVRLVARDGWTHEYPRGSAQEARDLAKVLSLEYRRPWTKKKEPHRLWGNVTVRVWLFDFKSAGEFPTLEDLTRPPQQGEEDR